ncbi:hypothetical protein [Desulforhopalus singaporensis]|uniref:Uncharacterized protein n=1 Tax=Desulforhopalus singaporensis TaxID=91360 RepID=A0A1H0UR57_9BACT|nr:hypothetical protein [Desulforhopalus singaporensis]SDP68692.1 hypothetical protein SAMN05660330_03683 [Desulforhopalus singaporensis]
MRKTISGFEKYRMIIGLVAFFFFLLSGSADAACTWKTSDIMDPRIDIGAQKSLMRQMSAGPPRSISASAMIGAVKSGKLAGILLPPRQAVASRAARMTPKKGYWQLLSGRNSVCLHEPAGEPPMIVYKEKLSEAMIDIALADAWPQCGLPTPQRACNYVADRFSPPPKPSDSSGEYDKGSVAQVMVYVHGRGKNYVGPIAAAQVWARVQGSDKTYRSSTDGGGKAVLYLILNRAAAEVYIQAEAPDYIPNFKKVIITAGPQHVVDLGLSPNP